MDLQQFPRRLSGNGLAAFVFQVPLYRRVELFPVITLKPGSPRHPLSKGAGVLQRDGDRKAPGPFGGEPFHLLDPGHRAGEYVHQTGNGDPGGHPLIDPVFISIAEILRQRHPAIVHQHSQPASLLETIPLVGLDLGHTSCKRSGKGKLGHRLPQIPNLIGIILDLVVIAVDLVIEVVDLLLILVDLVVQLAVILGIEKLPRRHRLPGGDIDPGDLSLRGGGGHGKAVRRHGNAGTLDGGGEGAVAGHARQGHTLLRGKKQGLDPKARPAQKGQDQNQSRPPPEKLPPFLCHGLGFPSLRPLFFCQKAHGCMPPPFKSKKVYKGKLKLV